MAKLPACSLASHGSHAQLIVLDQLTRGERVQIAQGPRFQGALAQHIGIGLDVILFAPCPDFARLPAVIFVLTHGAALYGVLIDLGRGPHRGSMLWIQAGRSRW